MKNKTVCYHCGDECKELIVENDKNFCCNGCKQVYLLLNENNLCSYYDFDKNPGIKAMGKFTGKRFEYLEDESVLTRLALFRSDTQVNVNLALPQVHCASCVYLLEKLHQIEPGIIQSKVNFQQREVFISFNPQLISLRKVVELLAFIGYEPNISLKDNTKKSSRKTSKKQIIQLGVAGFCFSNIMMLSFPEYFSSGLIEEHGLKEVFTWLIFFLSLPVLFYSARGIFDPAFKGLRQKDINIDVPIALAIIITFARSYYEIITGTGAGYLDSGTGIIFFMLIGRWFQNKTYDALSFDRDYQSYFPLGVTVIRNGNEENIPLPKLEVDDIIITGNDEMIPADAVLVSGKANIDYSFVSGENSTQEKNPGDLLYAGGRQIGTGIKLRVIKKPSQSYITQLWNNTIFEKNKVSEDSFIHPWSRYFTLALFSIAAIAAAYWYVADSSKVLPVITSVLIVACPCSLLLTSTFTFGNMLRIFGHNKLYLKNATVIESLSHIDTIVFDKTGTITRQEKSGISYVGIPLSGSEKVLVKYTAAQSSHTLSKTIKNYITDPASIERPEIEAFTEFPGKGIAASANGNKVQMGAATFISPGGKTTSAGNSEVHIKINDTYKGYFEVNNKYRDGISEMAASLSKQFKLHILSGDNDAERENLQRIFGKDTPIHFTVSPQEKLDYILKLQQNKANVLMVGDGLNDAGALMQANVGIAVSDNTSRFSPACDGIIDGNVVNRLSALIHYARSGRFIVSLGFTLSILYNFVGLSFAVQAKLSPVVAAILMPASSISLVAFAILASTIVARRKGVK
jgi:Cu+-exporting ATPase